MASTPKFHWKQRLALVRHNLHTASLTQDFTFFKSLQALNVLCGTDHVAALTNALASSSNTTLEDQEDMADSLMLSLDKFNAVVACVHEDAFKSVYDSVRPSVKDHQRSRTEAKILYHASVAAERKTIAQSIDKMFNSAVDAISGQPERAQEPATWLFILGTSFVADAIQICLSHIDNIECSLDDQFRLDAYWSDVQDAVATATTAMKGVFKLMDQAEPATPRTPGLSRTVSNENSPIEGSAEHIPHEGYAKSMFRRMSSAFAGPVPHAASNSGSSASSSSTLPSRRASSASSFISAPSRKSSAVSTTSTGGRNRGISNASMNDFAQNMPSKTAHCGLFNTMEPIAGTPASEGGATRVNPFETTFGNNVVFNSNRRQSTTSMSSIGKHARQWSQDLDSDEDICPTTPTRGVWTQQDQMIGQSAGFSQKPRSQLRRSVPNDAARATMSEVHLPDVAGVSGPAAHTAAAPIWGMRRRSVNVSGERPSFDVGGAMEQTV